MVIFTPVRPSVRLRLVRSFARPSIPPSSLVRSLICLSDRPSVPPSFHPRTVRPSVHPFALSLGSEVRVFVRSFVRSFENGIRLYDRRNGPRLGTIMTVKL